MMNQDLLIEILNILLNFAYFSTYLNYQNRMCLRIAFVLINPEL